MQTGTSTDLQQNSYTIVWQASSHCSSSVRTETAPDWRVRWLLSAGQLQLRGPSPQPGTSDKPFAIFAALQRMLAFLQAAGPTGKAYFLQAQS